jgi:hypothetical protein
LKQGRFDQDLRKAIQLSLEDQKQMIKKENNKILEDDSFDMLSNYDDNHGFKVKKDADRKLLKGIGMYREDHKAVAFFANKKTFLIITEI